MIIERISLALGPIAVALVLAGIILIIAGVDPISYYAYVLQRGLFSWIGLQQTLTRMAPLLFIAASLIVAFAPASGILAPTGNFFWGR